LIYILAVVLAIIATLVLVFYKAPQLLRVTFITGLAAIVVFMLINIFWKISLHTAFMSASVAALIIIYGGIAAWTLILLPPVGWARIQLRQHSPMQVVAGALLSAAIVLLVFQCFHMVNW
jgi:membrane-associated phospholipid phosphatase